MKRRPIGRGHVRGRETRAQRSHGSESTTSRQSDRAGSGRRRAPAQEDFHVPPQRGLGEIIHQRGERRDWHSPSRFRRVACQRSHVHGGSRRLDDRVQSGSAGGDVERALPDGRDRRADGGHGRLPDSQAEQGGHRAGRRPSDAERTGQDDRLHPGPAVRGTGGGRIVGRRRRAGRVRRSLGRVAGHARTGRSARRPHPPDAGRASAHERFQRLAAARTSRGSRPHADARSAAADIKPSPPAAWTASLSVNGPSLLFARWPDRTAAIGGSA